MTASSNWTRRNGSNYRRLCARPGCGAPAAATLRFQPTQREAWLVDLEDDGARTEGDLCARHAAGLVLPRGWQLHNSLTSARSETSEPALPAPRARRAAVPRAARRRRTQTTATELPGLSPIEESPPAPKLRVAPDAGPAPDPAPLVAPATPEESEALAETLDAQTPLLRRAFSNVLPPESDA
jgi:Protein of unknown function (DUF3499)